MVDNGPAAGCSGRFYTDEQLLRDEGVGDCYPNRLAACEHDLTPALAP